MNYALSNSFTQYRASPVYYMTSLGAQGKEFRTSIAVTSAGDSKVITGHELEEFNAWKAGQSKLSISEMLTIAERCLPHGTSRVGPEIRAARVDGKEFVHLAATVFEGGYGTSVLIGEMTARGVELACKEMLSGPPSSGVAKLPDYHAPTKAKPRKALVEVPWDPEGDSGL